jgi:hypothetical protein
MLSHPMTNTFMGISSILGLNLEFFDRIYFVALQEHQDKYQFHSGFVEELQMHGLAEKSEVVFLEEQTSSQSETVCKLIEKKDLDGFIFIKDSDGYYECKIYDQVNQVAFFDLNDMDDINARSKSYIELDINGVLTNIVEKHVVSSTFSSGGYGFASAKEFVETYKNIHDYRDECYVSDVIFNMMLSGSKFIGLRTSNFKDWGTLDAWNKYKSQYKCLFVDIDGTLVTNSSHQFPPYIGEGQSLTENISVLRDLYSSGKVKIILTTSRPERYRNTTINELKEKGIPYDEIVMGLPHCQRVIVNDFAKSNPYPSCVAINIPRNENNLKEFLK